MNGTVPPPPTASKRSKPLDLPGIAKRRGVLILLAGAVLAILIIPALLLVIRPKYVTTASLLVDAGKEVSITGKEREVIPGDVGDYTRTQIGRMKDLTVLRTAIARLPANERPVFCEKGQSDIQQAVALLKRLSIAETPRTRLIVARVEAEEPRSLGSALNAVLETFLARLQEEREEQYASRLAYLRQERKRIEDQLSAEHARLLALAAPIATKAFLHEGYNVHLAKLEQIQRLFWDAEAECAERESQLVKAQADRAALRELSLQPYADEKVADNFGINRIEQYTYEQLQSMRVTVDGLTPDNQDRKYVEERMKAMTDYLDGYRKQVNDITIRILTEKRSHDLEQDVLKATSARDAARHTRDGLARQLAEAATEASRISETIFSASDVTFAIGQLRDRLSTLTTRIDDCEMEAKTPSRITIDSRAADPSRPTTNTRPRVFGMGIAMAYCSVIAICLGFELLDGRVRSRRELEAALGGPGPDPIPWHDSTAGTPFARVVAMSPEADAAQAIRRLAARLERERRAHGGSVVLVAGAGRGAGATAVAANLATALAAIVPRVLTVHLTREGGDEGEMDGRSGVTTLRRTDARRDLRELVAEARQAHDFVLLDTAPLPGDDVAQLAVLDCDAALLVVRADKSMFREVVAALEVLRAAQIPALTAVLNRAKHCPRPEAEYRAPVQQWLGIVTRLHLRVEGSVRARWAALRRRTQAP